MEMLVKLGTQILTNFKSLRPKDEILQYARTILGPKLDFEPPGNFFVRQGCAAISTKSLRTGGLATCTALVFTSATHNFMVHVDSCTKPEWLSAQIGRYLTISGPVIGVFRFNAHGRGLNQFAASLTTNALRAHGLLERCVDDNGISGFHTIVAADPNSEGSKGRIFVHLRHG